MKSKTVHLAEQLLSGLPRSDITDLMKMLAYFNGYFAEKDRAEAMRVGSVTPPDPALEREVKQLLSESLTLSRGSQDVYMMTTAKVCRLCGK